MVLWFRRLSPIIVLGVLAGCVTQMQGINVTTTVPDDRALAHLRNLDTTFNAPSHVTTPPCIYSDNAMAGSKVQFLVVGVTADRRADVPYAQWRVDEIRAGQGMAGPFYTIFVKAPDGATCTPLRSSAGTPEAVVMPKIEETLTALVSLGVAYDPNRLGSSR